MAAQEPPLSKGSDMAGWNAETAAGPWGNGGGHISGRNVLLHLLVERRHPAGLPPQGVFVQDTRILSNWGLTINGQSLEPLSAETKEPYRALFIGRVPPFGRLCRQPANC